MVWEYSDNHMVRKLHIDGCLDAKHISKLTNGRLVLWNDHAGELIEINIDDGNAAKLMTLQDKYDDILYIEDYVFMGRSKNGNCVLNVYETPSKSQVKVLKNIQKCSVVAYGKRRMLLINESEGFIVKLNY